MTEKYLKSPTLAIVLASRAFERHLDTKNSQPSEHPNIYVTNF